MSTARNLFEKASPAAKAGLRKAKDIAEPVEGIEMLASIKVVEDALGAVKELYEGEIKVAMHEHFVAEGVVRHKRPENYKGTEGDADASLQLRKRSVLSKLSEDDLAVLTEHAIPVERVPDTFKINPKYAEDESLMRKVNAALVKSVKDIPDDFFEVEAGQSVVSDETVDAVFKKNRETLAALLPLVTTLGIRAKLKNNTVESIQKAFDRVNKALGNDLSVPEAEKAARVEKLPTFARAKKTKAYFGG